MSNNALTGITETYRTPGNYAEIVFAQGPASAAAGTREVVLVMPKTTDGLWTVNTLYEVPNTYEAEVGAGAGSPLHRAARMFLRMNRDAKLWAVVYSETSGTTNVAAALDLDIVGTASAAGILSVWIVGELTQFSFPSGATPTEIGDGIVGAINAKNWLPCTAANNAGVVTLTAKIDGISMGTGTLGVIRCHAQITPGITTTAVFTDGDFLGETTAGVEGTVTEAANLATALAAIYAIRKYYVVTSVNDATSLTNLKTSIVNKSEPKRGRRSRGIYAWPGAQAAGATIAIGLNHERMQCVWQLNSEHDCAELAGAFAAILQKEEDRDATHNFNGQSLTGFIKRAWSTSDYPEDDDFDDALTDGMTPIASNDFGTYIVQSVTTRSKNSAGTLDDSRASRSCKVSGSDLFVDTVLLSFGQNLAQKKFKDDEYLSDGSVNTNQKQIPGVTRPSQCKSLITQVLDNMKDQHLQNVQASKDSISTVKSKFNAGRCVMGMELHVIDWLDQTTLRVAEVSQG